MPELSVDELRALIREEDLPLPAPAPEGVERIAAYRRWVGRR